jgi:hypothetical protein
VSLSGFFKCLNKTKKDSAVQDVTISAFDFVLAKRIQWEWDTVYGEGKYVVIFGGLHIEMACLKLLGDLLRDCGWTTALSNADIVTS